MNKKSIFALLLSATLFATSSVSCLAATKTAEGFKNTASSSTTTDVDAFISGISGYDSAYSTVTKTPANVVSNDFWNNGRTIKYWSSHGANDGTMWGINGVTVVSSKVLECDWNYEEFLDFILKEEPLDAIFNSTSLDDGNVFVTKFFTHGIDDSFLWNSKSNEVYFDSEAFRNILRLGKEYQNRNCNYEQLMDGSMLCMPVDIQNPQQIAFIRVLMGDNAHYVGYPADDGAKSYLATVSPIAVNAAATEEERKIAHTFIKNILSYDAQKTMTKKVSFCMSVREDVLEEQIDSINTRNDIGIFLFPQIHLREDQIDNKADRKTLRELMKEAVPEKKMPRELQMLLIEELDAYFTGTIDENTVINNLTNRVGLYLSE